jgi:hypothetical protein
VSTGPHSPKGYTSSFVFPSIFKFFWDAKSKNAKQILGVRSFDFGVIIEPHMMFDIPGLAEEVWQKKCPSQCHQTWLEEENPPFSLFFFPAINLP